jgi:hypothetical protein
MKKPKPQPLLRFEPQRADADCCVASLATLLGVSYETILVEAARLRSKKKGKRNIHPHDTGMYFSELVKIAKALGRPLRYKGRCNLKKDQGVLSVLMGKGGLTSRHHAVVYVAGLIFDLSDCTVWLPEIYRRQFRAKFESILVPV